MLSRSRWYTAAGGHSVAGTCPRYRPGPTRIGAKCPRVARQHPAAKRLRSSHLRFRLGRTRRAERGPRASTQRRRRYLEPRQRMVRRGHGEDHRETPSSVTHFGREASKRRSGAGLTDPRDHGHPIHQSRGPWDRPGPGSDRKHAYQADNHQRLSIVSQPG